MRQRTFAALGFLLFTAAAQAQSTAFTYQGRLKNGAALASGLHDLRFRLFNAVSGGVQVGLTQCADNVAVSEGLFTTPIDFGQQFTVTTPLFLEIEVRADTGLNCSNPGGFVVLSPRQMITPAPVASHAKTAFSLAAADGSPTNAVIVDNNGKVGIGTLAPTHTVHVATADPTLALQDTDANATQVGYVSLRNADNVETAWVGFGTAGSPHLSVVNARTGGNITLLPFTGNVGIGTTTPTAKLEVLGDIRLGPAGQFRATAGEENLRIVRGSIASGGGVLAGSGFSVAHTSEGTYTITFATSFTSSPTVTATSDLDTSTSVISTAMVDSVTASSAIVRVRNSSVLDDNPFHFIAVGTR